MADLEPSLKPGRLKKRPDFLSVRNGKRLRGPLFLIETKARDDDGKAARYGLTVSKKCGNAVKRNRIRRRLKEAIRLHAGIDMAAATDYVIIARPELADIPFQRLVSELKHRLNSRA